MAEAPRLKVIRRNHYAVEIRPARDETWPDITFSDWQGRPKTIRPAKISFVLTGPGDTWYSDEPAAGGQIREISLSGHVVLRSGTVGKKPASAFFGTRLDEVPSWAADLIRSAVREIGEGQQS